MAARIDGFLKFKNNGYMKSVYDLSDCQYPEANL